MMKFDGLDEAIVGVGERFEPDGHRRHFIVYDYEKCLEIFAAQGMSRHEAQEWMEFNVTGAYIGESTPCFVYDTPAIELWEEDPDDE